ncbi:MAG: protein translocase subunit SecF [Candidatus Tectomicrobia bacterium]|nr:protein translocase subunit SecF [Candidatus Tectomicrobia bacterium]
MQLIPPGTTYDFLGRKKYAFAVSGGLILLSFVFFLARGLVPGIDFSGGTIVQMHFKSPVAIDAVRSALSGAGMENAVIQHFGQRDEVLVRLPQTEEDPQKMSDAVRQQIGRAFGKDAFEVQRVETVGPKVGRDLIRQAIMAIVYSMIGLIIYITIRFDFKFGVAAIVALIHDVLITLGAFSITGKEMSLTVIAALLTVVGYSLNDTIVVFDRIRENQRRVRKEGYETMVNASVNETLSRTILTSGTTLIVLVALFFLGGEVIHDFSFALLVGIIVGTYSSIFVASPIVVLWREHQRPDRSKAKLISTKR